MEFQVTAVGVLRLSKTSQLSKKGGGKKKKEKFGTTLFLKLTLRNGLNVSAETFHTQNSA